MFLFLHRLKYRMNWHDVNSLHCLVCRSFHLSSEIDPLYHCYNCFRIIDTFTLVVKTIP